MISRARCEALALDDVQDVPVDVATERDAEHRDQDSGIQTGFLPVLTEDQERRGRGRRSQPRIAADRNLSQRPCCPSEECGQPSVPPGRGGRPPRRRPARRHPRHEGQRQVEQALGESVLAAHIRSIEDHQQQERCADAERSGGRQTRSRRSGTGGIAWPRRGRRLGLRDGTPTLRGARPLGQFGVDPATLPATAPRNRPCAPRPAGAERRSDRNECATLRQAIHCDGPRSPWHAAPSL